MFHNVAYRPTVYKTGVKVHFNMPLVEIWSTQIGYVDILKMENLMIVQRLGIEQNGTMAAVITDRHLFAKWLNIWLELKV